MNVMQSGNAVLGVLLVIALAVFYVPAAIVVAGLVRMMALRILGVFRLKRIPEKSFREFYSAAKVAAKAGSVGELVRLMFYNPRGGVMLVMFLVPVALVLCVVVALASTAVITLVHRM